MALQDSDEEYLYLNTIPSRNVLEIRFYISQRDPSLREYPVEETEYQRVRARWSGLGDSDDEDTVKGSPTTIKPILVVRRFI